MVAALVLVFSLAAVVVPAGTAMAATLCVNPGGTGGCHGSIQDAINAANPAGGDTIIIAAGIYNEHDITINKSLTIQGAGAGNTFIDGQHISRVFHINGSYTVDMSGMTIRNGNTSGVGGGLYNNGGNVTMTSCTVSYNYGDDGGGGIRNSGGNVTLTNCTISDNDADEDGGGIENRDGNMTITSCTISDNHNWDEDGGGIYNRNGSMTITSCTISDNDTGEDGGGIQNSIGGNVTLTNCTISRNHADYDGGGIKNYSTLNMTNCTVRDNDADLNGGGIWNGGNVTLTNCTISGNTAYDGGGIYNNYDTVTMTNCTVSGNTAEGSVDHKGGGISNGGWLTMTNCTVSNNTAKGSLASGGGIYNYGTMTLKCTIVYGNMAPTDPNIYGLYDATECIIDSSDPLLGPLQNNGGPTETHALLAGSPAIDTCTDCTVDTDNMDTKQRNFGEPLETDQRGYKRPVDGDRDGEAICDIGAYEKQPPVGGIIEPVDRIGILAPWFGLAALMAVAVAVVVLIKRKRTA